MKVRSDMREDAHREYMSKTIRELGGCGAISSDGEHVCILNPGHEQPHGWEASERTADADAVTVREALQRDPEHLTFSREAHAALDRLVARNQQLQEALAALCEAAADLLADDDMPNHWDDCVCSYCTRNRALRAALACVRARTPA